MKYLSDYNGVLFTLFFALLFWFYQNLAVEKCPLFDFISLKEELFDVGLRYWKLSKFINLSVDRIRMKPFYLRKDSFKT